MFKRITTCVAASAFVCFASLSMLGFSSHAKAVHKASGPHWALEIDGVLVPGIQSVSGIQSASGLTFADSSTAAPGGADNQLTITRAFVSNSLFLQWRKLILSGKTDRRSLSQIFYDANGVETLRINFYNCWPSKWSILTQPGNTLLPTTESLTVQWDNVEMKQQ